MEKEVLITDSVDIEELIEWNKREIHHASNENVRTALAKVGYMLEKLKKSQSEIDYKVFEGDNYY